MIKSDFLKCFTCVAILVFSLVPCRRKEIKCKAYTHSKGECVAEVSSGRILFSGNGKTELPMASTTKIMTAYLAIERLDLSSIVTVGDSAPLAEGSSVYLKKGDRFTVLDLLYGLMLRSGNDAAETLATACSGSVEKFAAEMTEMAISLGAKHTSFKNPHGLPAEGHYTTAEDLALISCAAMKNETFRTIVAAKSHTATELVSGEKRVWKNKNKMLNFYDGASGVKTGYTKEAGRCLVSSAEKDGMRLVCVVLSSPQMYERSAELLDECFHRFRMVKIVDPSRFSYRLPTKGNDLYGELYIREEFVYPLAHGEKAEPELFLPEKLPERLRSGEKAGEMKIYLAKQLIFSQNIYKL